MGNVGFKCFAVLFRSRDNMSSLKRPDYTDVKKIELRGDKRFAFALEAVREKWIFRFSIRP